MQAVGLARTWLLDMLRQRTIAFSCFLLPVVVTWSTWWVTAELPMDFRLDAGDRVQTTMVQVHLVTGALTAMAITSGLFSFLLLAENHRIADRLRLTGYSPAAITLGPLLAILLVLVAAAVATTGLAAGLDRPADLGAFALSVVLVTAVYAGLGALLATVFPRVMEGSFLILLVSFIDLMMVSNPMGEGTYLQSWTYWAPGFWPTQLALEGGILGTTDTAGRATAYSLAYLAAALALALLMRAWRPAWLRRLGGRA